MLLRHIAAGETQPELSIPNWLQILSEIATISEKDVYAYL
jgi:hypothetical protein